MADLDAEVQALRDRIDALLTLEDGWLDGDDGIAPTRRSAEGARVLLEMVTECDRALPAIFPTEAGGLCLYWNEPDRVLCIDITADGVFEFTLGALDHGYHTGARVPDTTDLGAVREAVVRHIPARTSRER